MATTKKAAAKKVAAPKISKITLAASGAIKRNPKRQGFSAALAVIKELQKRAAGKVAILKFLDAAYQEVKVGGGHDGGEQADPTGPPLEKSNG